MGKDDPRSAWHVYAATCHSDWDVRYALIPRRSLKSSLEGQASQKAGQIVGQVSDSMDLEAQSIADSERRLQEVDLARELLRSRGRDFWDA
ncbi:MAG: hypothetical protein ACI9W4_002548 [Rhodothermales bacterium]|jgi:hypothetical protein